MRFLEGVGASDSASESGISGWAVCKVGRLGDGGLGGVAVLLVLGPATWEKCIPGEEEIGLTGGETMGSGGLLVELVGVSGQAVIEALGLEAGSEGVMGNNILGFLFLMSSLACFR